MTARKPKFMPEPRGWNDKQVCARLNKGPDWLKTHLPELEATGFPPPDPITGDRDAKAIELWWDRRSGIEKDMTAKLNPWDKELVNGTD